MVLFTGTISLLEKALDYSIVKQNVIAHNIANADTPNYKAKDVQFSTYLNDALEKQIQAKLTDERHIPFQSRDPQIKSQREKISVITIMEIVLISIMKWRNWPKTRFIIKR